MCLDFPASLSEPHFMLKLIIAGLFWDSHLPTPPSSDDTDTEDKAEATNVCPLRYVVMVCATSPHMVFVRVGSLLGSQKGIGGSAAQNMS